MRELCKVAPEMTRALALTLVFATTACTGMVDTSHGNGSGGDDDGSGSAVEGPDAAVPLTWSEVTIARAKLWVDAQVPYCQAPNHERDYDAACASTCTRPDVADWDPYRSDCSGFISWAWGLPSPGRTTGDFAPFTTDITSVIAGADLQTGDALNNNEHIVLFKEWTDVGKTATFMEEPGCSSATPYAHEFTADVTITGHTVVILHHGTFTAIHYDAAM